jgi:hypothetical protein
MVHKRFLCLPAKTVDTTIFAPKPDSKLNGTRWLHRSLGYLRDGCIAAPAIANARQGADMAPLELRIWGSGVRISSGAPAKSGTSAISGNWYPIAGYYWAITPANTGKRHRSSASAPT